MRASRQPARARRPASTSAIAGASLIAAASRSFACAARACKNGSAAFIFRHRRKIERSRRFALGVQPAKTSLVASATPGLTSTAAKRRQIKRLGKHFADAAHQPCARSQTDRHVGAGGARGLVKARIVGREIVGLRQKPKRGSRVGRAAANPGRDRQVLLQMEGAEHDAGDARGKRARRLEHEIVGVRPRLRRLRPGRPQAPARRPAPKSAGRRSRRTRPGFRSRDSRRRGGRAPAASD